MPLASNSEWEAWGRRDPLWGVASWAGREKGGTNPWTDEEFYALGADWNDFNNAWRGFGARLDSSVLEIGCGAGRITQMLAKEFGTVIASDISADVLDYAKARVRDKNISWVQSNGLDLPTPPESVDAVFSCHVLQHLPDVAAQLAIFRDIYRVLTTGGSFFVHTPMYIWPPNNARFSHLAEMSFSVFKALAIGKSKLQSFRMKVDGKLFMRGVSAEMEKMISDVKALGFSDVQAAIVIVRTDQGLHTCLYGRK